MDEPSSEAGDILAGRYELIETIGRGGFGVVFRARQLNMDREVAIKMLPAQFMALPDIVERFKREAKLTSRLHHPNTITIHDHGRHGNSLYIVMELLRGEDLADLLKREHTLPPERIITIASQVLKSLAEAHGNGIVHRDLKPENIFICENDDDEELVKVLDFGIAKLASPDTSKKSQRQITVTGSTVGTPIYMSPEQAAGEQVTHSTDLYALGVLMYEMACGRPPFASDNPVQTMRSHIFEEVPALTNVALRGTPLERVILRALAKEPRLRHADAREFLAELRGRSSYISSVPVDMPGMSEVSDSVVQAFEGANTLEFEDEHSEIQLLPSKLGGGISTVGLSAPRPNSTARYDQIDTRAPGNPLSFGDASRERSFSKKHTPRYVSPEDSSLLTTPDPLKRESTTSSILRVVDLPIDTPMDDEVIVLTQTKREGTPLEHIARNVPIIDEDEEVGFEDDDLEEGVAPPTANGQQHQGDWSFGDLGKSREAVRLVESGAYPTVGDEVTPEESKRATFVLTAIFIAMCVGCLAYAYHAGLIAF